MRTDRRRIGERRRRTEVCMMAGAVVVVPSPIRQGRVCSASPLLYREREREKESDVITVKESD